MSGYSVAGYKVKRSKPAAVASQISVAASKLPLAGCTRADKLKRAVKVNLPLVDYVSWSFARSFGYFETIGGKNLFSLFILGVFIHGEVFGLMFIWRHSATS